MLIFRIKKVNDSFQALPKIFIRKKDETNYRELLFKKMNNLIFAMVKILLKSKLRCFHPENIMQLLL